MSSEEAVAAIIASLLFSANDWLVVALATAAGGLIALMAFNRVTRLSSKVFAMAAVDGLSLGGFPAVGFVAAQRLAAHQVPFWWTLAAFAIVIGLIVAVGDISRKLVRFDKELFRKSLETRPDGPPPSRPHIQNLEDQA